MKKTVLIIEDNKMNITLFTIIVESAGYKVLGAENGEKGIKMAEDNDIDLILMDIQMPRMDGVTALKILQSGKKTGSIPVIAMTSYAMRGDEERFMKHGFKDYISKPIDKEHLLETIKNILKD